MQKKYIVLRSVVGLVSLYHVLMGIVLNCPVNVISNIMTHLMGATKMPDASALFPARMLGTYMIVFGIGLGTAAWNPLKNRAMLTVGAILALLRVIQRLLQAQDLNQTLGISSCTNWISILILTLFAATLAFFRITLYRDKTMEIVI
jgi:hypothetical protein